MVPKLLRMKRQLEQAWLQYVQDNAGIRVDVMFLEESDPRPPKPYVSLKIISGPTGRGFDTFSFNSADDLVDDPKSKSVRFDLAGERFYTMNIQAFASKIEPHIAQDIIDRLHTLLDSPLTTEFFKKAADIAIVNRGSPADITAPLETGFERRTSLDVVFGSSQSIDVNPSLIESTKVSGKLKKTDGSEHTSSETIPAPQP